MGWIDETVSSEDRHAPLSRAAQSWLIEAANPFRTSEAPAQALPPAELANTLRAAELHGVLPQAIRAIALAPSPESEKAIAAMREKLVHHVGYEMMLSHHGALVIAAFKAAGIRAAMVKGPVFARRLYKPASLRTFTDIDILIDTTSRDRARDVMTAHGFRLHEEEYRAGQEYFEDKWLLASDNRVSIEVHCNLVHNPRLRKGASFILPDLLDTGAGDGEDATALLLTAALHAAASHQFDRLQHLVDIALAASGAAGPIDVARLAHVSRRCGARSSLHSALVLAGRAFAAHALVELADDLVPSAIDRISAQFVTVGAVLSARSTERTTQSWRRKALRQVIRLGSHTN